METGRHSEVIRERAQRHNRLLKYIRNYALTPAEARKLERIKANTMMEINIRYLRCEQNRQYKFPRAPSSSSEEDEEDANDPLAKKENIVYDLSQQNQVSGKLSLQRKANSLGSSRRVVSLEIDRSNDRNRLLRLQAKSKNHFGYKNALSSKNISRKNSFTDRIRKEVTRVRLPEVRGAKGGVLKTEGRGGEEEQMQSVIGKKLQTEASSPSGRLKGVEKYLKRMEMQQREGELKATFKRRGVLGGKA